MSEDNEKEKKNVLNSSIVLLSQFSIGSGVQWRWNKESYKDEHKREKTEVVCSKDGRENTTSLFNKKTY